MRHSEFYLKVANALAGCQMLEQEIRLYIAAAHLAIRRNLPTHIPYKVPEDGNAGSSLGNLIGKFRNLSNDSNLVDELNKFNKKRNKLAHRAISSCMNPDGEIDVPLHGFLPHDMNMEEWLSEIIIGSDVLRRRVFEAAAALDFDYVSGAS